ncbi:BnaA09g55870D [Brassica napus]|uniref:BnaA09g55870D protein n=2 Tax=Brassica TaxID=3705 RepID=A0A078IWY2_BRANA|nr:BnaA09g55870D [Brassica napus]VDC63381.1 unnamed protein product [Brassica rapa]
MRFHITLQRAHQTGYRHGVLLTEVYLDTWSKYCGQGDQRQSVDRVLVEETGENINRNLGSGLLDIPEVNTNIVFGFPSLVRFSWGTCTNAFEGQC